MMSLVMSVHVMVPQINVVSMVVSVVVPVVVSVVVFVVVSVAVVIVSVVVSVVVSVMVVVVSSRVVKVVLFGDFFSVWGNIFTSHSHKLARPIIGNII